MFKGCLYVSDPFEQPQKDSLKYRSGCYQVRVPYVSDVHKEGLMELVGATCTLRTPDLQPLRETISGLGFKPEKG